MTEVDFGKLVADQREYSLSGKTRPKAWRSPAQALKAMVDENRDQFYDALWSDLRRNRIDADLMDVDYCIKEADYALEHLDGWMKPMRVPTPLVSGRPHPGPPRSAGRHVDHRRVE